MPLSKIDSDALASGDFSFQGNINASNIPISTQSLYPLVSDTAKSATSTVVDFTGIPSWVKRITVMFSEVSTNGTSIYITQLGDAGGFENTGYVSVASSALGTQVAQTAGFGLVQGNSAASTTTGALTLVKLSGNTWVGSGLVNIGPGNLHDFAGSKTLSDTLTQVRITTVNGTDTFDAGTINILYE
jgi:hypothetical protein